MSHKIEQKNSIFVLRFCERQRDFDGGELEFNWLEFNVSANDPNEAVFFFKKYLDEIKTEYLELEYPKMSHPFYPFERGFKSEEYENYEVDPEFPYYDGRYELMSVSKLGVLYVNP